MGGFSALAEGMQLHYGFSVPFIAMWFERSFLRRLPRIALTCWGWLDRELCSSAVHVLALTSLTRRRFFVARSRIAAVVGIPIGRVQLVDTSAQAQLDDAVQIFEDVQVVLLTLDPALERAALVAFLHTAAVADLDELLDRAYLHLDRSEPMLTALPEAFGQLTVRCRSNSIG